MAWSIPLALGSVDIREDKGVPLRASLPQNRTERRLWESPVSVRTLGLVPRPRSCRGGGAHPARKWQPVGGVLARAAIAGEAGFPATDPSQGLVDGQTVDQGGGGRQGQHRLGDDGIPTNPLPLYVSPRFSQNDPSGLRARLTSANISARCFT